MTNNIKSIRIGCGSGFWGDWLEAPVRLVTEGKIDYLVLDYLAEVTMSILAKQLEKNSDYGYVRDFVNLIEKIAPIIAEKNIKVIANAGGMNPLACAKAIKNVLGKHSLLKIAAITGDNLVSQLDAISQNKENLKNLDNGEYFLSIKSRVKSANAYLGADSIICALGQGAQIIITGRVADPSLAIAAMRHEFSWADDDWDKLSAGAIAGHVIECGAQATGGNFLADWRAVKDFANIGYPIAEVSADGNVVITKHENTGGLVDSRTVKEQLVYEISDPCNYITPDVIADFTSISVTNDGENRVKICGAKGKPKPEKYKVSISYEDGFMTSSTLLYSWPDAYDKAKVAAEIIWDRLKQLGIKFARTHTEFIGANACHGQLSEISSADIQEVMLRLAVQDTDIKKIERFTREIAPLVLNGPPGCTGYFGSKGDIKEVYAYWPTLIERSNVTEKVILL